MFKFKSMYVMLATMVVLGSALPTAIIVTEHYKNLNNHTYSVVSGNGHKRGGSDSGDDPTPHHNPWQNPEDPNPSGGNNLGPGGKGKSNVIKAYKCNLRFSPHFWVTDVVNNETSFAIGYDAYHPDTKKEGEEYCFLIKDTVDGEGWRMSGLDSDGKLKYPVIGNSQIHFYFTGDRTNYAYPGDFAALHNMSEPYYVTAPGHESWVPDNLVWPDQENYGVGYNGGDKVDTDDLQFEPSGREPIYSHLGGPVDDNIYLEYRNEGLIDPNFKFKMFGNTDVPDGWDGSSSDTYFIFGQSSVPTDTDLKDDKPDDYYIDGYQGVGNWNRVLAAYGKDAKVKNGDLADKYFKKYGVCNTFIEAWKKYNSGHVDSADKDASTLASADDPFGTTEGDNSMTLPQHMPDLLDAANTRSGSAWGLPHRITPLMWKFWSFYKDYNYSNYNGTYYAGSKEGKWADGDSKEYPDHDDPKRDKDSPAARTDDGVFAVDDKTYTPIGPNDTSISLLASPQLLQQSSIIGMFEDYITAWYYHVSLDFDDDNAQFLSGEFNNTLR